MTPLSVILVLCVTIIHSATSHPAHTELEIFNNLSIVGGHNVSIEDVPFMATLKIKHVKNRWRYCTGHCCYNYVKIKVSVASSKRFDGEVYEAVNARVHELFNWTSYYDICVVKLNDALTFGPKINKITLADDNVKLEDGTYFNTLGWGRTEIGNPSSSSSYLQEASVPLVTKCQEKMKRLIMSRTILCACSKNATIAKGDSGGPLTLNNNTIQVGITSSGPYGSDNIGIFVNIASLRDWVNAAMVKLLL